jgi:hypothetical protein
MLPGAPVPPLTTHQPPHAPNPTHYPQTLLIALVWALATPSRFSFEHASGHQDAAAGAPAATAAGGGQEVYSIVLDAGSTGSRIHVFKFVKAADGQLLLISDTFEQLKPGLSSFRDEPEKAAQSLKPLLEIAMKTVPEQLRPATGISLKATAGLRLLPGTKADDILKAVAAFMRQFPFRLQGDDAVGIMDGERRAAVGCQNGGGCQLSVDWTGLLVPTPSPLTSHSPSS